MPLGVSLPGGEAAGASPVPWRETIEFSSTRRRSHRRGPLLEKSNKSWIFTRVKHGWRRLPLWFEVRMMQKLLALQSLFSPCGVSAQAVLSAKHRNALVQIFGSKRFDILPPTVLWQFQFTGTLACGAGAPDLFSMNILAPQLERFAAMKNPKSRIPPLRIPPLTIPKYIYIYIYGDFC